MNMARAQEAITNSERTEASCDHRWLIGYGLGLAKVGPRAQPLDRGTIWHAGLEAYTRPGMAGVQYAAAVQAIKDAGHRLAVERLGPLAGMDSAAQEDTALALDMLERYHAHHGGAEPWVLLESEATFVASVVNEDGNTSPVTRYAGKVDKLVMLAAADGLWLVEHKSTTMDLARWVETQTYRPQALSYAWAVQRVTGKRVLGVIYDLALAKAATLPEAMPCTADRKRLRNVAGVPTTTAERYLAALALHGFDLDDQEFYRPTLAALQDREAQGWWFRRHHVRFRPEDIERTGREIYTVATRLRRGHDAVSPARRTLAMLAKANPRILPSAIVAALDQHGENFPRNPAMCHEHGRPCPLMDLCRERSLEAASEYTVKPARHAELDA